MRFPLGHAVDYTWQPYMYSAVTCGWGVYRVCVNKVSSSKTQYPAASSTTSIGLGITSHISSLNSQISQAKYQVFNLLMISITHSYANMQLHVHDNHF